MKTGILMVFLLFTGTYCMAQQPNPLALDKLIFRMAFDEKTKRRNDTRKLYFATTFPVDTLSASSANGRSGNVRMILPQELIAEKLIP